jgi:hypothetical protein
MTPTSGFAETSVSDLEIRRPSSVDDIAEIVHRLATAAGSSVGGSFLTPVFKPMEKFEPS